MNSKINTDHVNEQTIDDSLDHQQIEKLRQLIVSGGVEQAKEQITLLGGVDTLIPWMVAHCNSPVCQIIFTAFSREELAQLFKTIGDDELVNKLFKGLKVKQYASTEEEHADKQNRMSVYSVAACANEKKLFELIQQVGFYQDPKQHNAIAEQKKHTAELNQIKTVYPLLHELSRYLAKQCVFDPATVSAFDQSAITKLEQAFSARDSKKALCLIQQLTPQKKIFSIKSVDGESFLAQAAFFGFTAACFVELLTSLSRYSYAAITTIDSDQKNFLVDSLELNDAGLMSCLITLLGKYAEQALSAEVAGLSVFQHAANRVGVEVMTVLLNVLPQERQAELIVTDAENFRRNMVSFSANNVQGDGVFTLFSTILDRDIMREQLMQVDIACVSPIHYACLTGCLGRVKALLAYFTEEEQQRLLSSNVFKLGFVKVLPVNNHPEISDYLRSLYPSSRYELLPNSEVRIHQDITPVDVEGVTGCLTDQDDVILIMKGQDGKAVSLSHLCLSLSDFEFNRSILRSVMSCLKDRYPGLWHQFEQAYRKSELNRDTLRAATSSIGGEHAELWQQIEGAYLNSQKEEQLGLGYISLPSERGLFDDLRHALCDEQIVTLPEVCLVYKNENSLSCRRAVQYLTTQCGYNNPRHQDGGSRTLRLLESSSGEVSYRRWDDHGVYPKKTDSSLVTFPKSNEWSSIINEAVNEPVIVERLVEASWDHFADGGPEKVYHRYSFYEDFFLKPLYVSDTIKEPIPLEAFDMLSEKTQHCSLTEAVDILKKELEPLQLKNVDVRSYAKAMHRYNVANALLTIQLAMHLLMPENADDDDLSLMIHLLRSEHLAEKNLAEQRQQVMQEVINQHVLEEKQHSVSNESRLVDPVLYQLRLLICLLNHSVLNKESFDFDCFVPMYRFLMKQPLELFDPVTSSVQQRFAPEDLNSFRQDWPFMKGLYAQQALESATLVQHATEARLKQEERVESSQRLGSRQPVDWGKEEAKRFTEFLHDRGIVERERSFKEKLYDGTKTASILLLKMLAPLIMIFAMPYVIQAIGIMMSWIAAHVMQVLHAIPAML